MILEVPNFLKSHAGAILAVMSCVCAVQALADVNATAIADQTCALSEKVEIQVFGSTFEVPKKCTFGRTFSQRFSFTYVFNEEWQLEKYPYASTVSYDKGAVTIILADKCRDYKNCSYELATQSMNDFMDGISEELASIRGETESNTLISDENRMQINTDERELVVASSDCREIYYPSSVRCKIQVQRGRKVVGIVISEKFVHDLPEIIHLADSQIEKWVK